MNTLRHGLLEPKAVVIRRDGVELHADVAQPAGGGRAGVVVFAHGSGSSRLSPRNRAVAGRLVSAGLATIMLDLLTAEEECSDRITRQYRFDIPRLARRVGWATDWLAGQAEFAGAAIGYFGASTGSAAALIAAAQRPEQVAAVVSRGGRPDLAQAYLHKVRAPTLLIVGGNDPQVLALNEEAAGNMHCPVRLETVAGASHLFEEPGALEYVADLACEWFERYLLGQGGSLPD